MKYKYHSKHVKELSKKDENIIDIPEDAKFITITTLNNFSSRYDGVVHWLEPIKDHDKDSDEPRQGGGLDG